MDNHQLFTNSLINEGRSHLNAITWPYDKYPGMAELNKGSKIILLDQEGPGVVSQIHSSFYMEKKPFSQWNWNKQAASGLVVKVWYDKSEKPAINMPWMDFLGDIQCESEYYSTTFFSKVKYSHNFRLEMPFAKHIHIEIENTSDLDLIGYTDIQYESLPTLPENCGYLYVDYRRGQSLIPDDLIEVFNIDRGGSIAAHWLQLVADNPNCANGEFICEANNEVFIDGEKKPSMEYLGTEDYYGYSWGFKDTQSDGYAGIIKNESLPNGGSKIGMLRCRGNDKIRYGQSCRIVMDYRQEKFSMLKDNGAVYPLDQDGFPKAQFEADYISCYYYYSLP